MFSSSIAAWTFATLVSFAAPPGQAEGPMEGPRAPDESPPEGDGADASYEGDEEDAEDEDSDPVRIVLPTARVDLGGRGSLTARSPVQFSLRVQAGADVFWIWESREVGISLVPIVAYRYDHPSGPRLVRRDLAEAGVGLGFRHEHGISVGYRGALVVGAVGDPRELGLGLRHGLELGYASFNTAWFGASVNHEILWRPELEHALLVTGWIDLIETTVALLMTFG